MATDPNNRSQRHNARRWLVTVQVIVLVAFLLTAIGASGIFAIQMCPGCPPERPEIVMPPQLPEELEKGTQSAK